jgi:hypothetical protein
MIMITGGIMMIHAMLPTASGTQLLRDMIGDPSYAPAGFGAQWLTNVKAASESEDRGSARGPPAAAEH